MATKSSNTVRINGTLHKIPEIKFPFACRFEAETGVPLFTLVPNKRDIRANLIALACVMHVFDCSEAEAMDIMQHHLEGGGDVMSIVEPFLTAMYNSEYFQKGLVNQAGPEKANSKVRENPSE